jgi:uroporphyrinogen decarboxylase
MTSRERVQLSFAHTQPDYTPCDYFATPEINQGLMKHFAVDSEDQIRDRLGTDIRYVNPPYTGPELPSFADGSYMTIWGFRQKPTPNEYGEYDESVSWPYAEWKTVEQAEAFDWPSPDSFDYDAIPALCEQYPDAAIGAGWFGVQDFINGIAFGRGVEQVLIDIALEDPVFLYIVERRHRFFMEFIERTLQASKGRIDMVLCGDDLGTQRGLLISPEQFDNIFAPKKREFFDMVHSYGVRISHHCCGSSREIIPRFIDLGMDALQTIQPQAAGMNPYELKKQFAGQITFHGAVDAQGWLQKASCEEIAKEVDRLMDEVGRDGGYILSPSHNIQPDTPIGNVLAIYDTVAKRCNKPNLLMGQ